MTKRITAFLLAVLAIITLQAQHLPDGDWNGALSLPGFSLRLVFHFTRDNEGALKVNIDSPDQGAYSIPGEATLEGDRVTVTVPRIGLSYTGTLSDDGMAIKGEFRQLGQSLPLDLKRVLDVQDTGGEQNETGYSEKEVTLRLANDVTLAGTITLPDGGKAPYPAIVFISGSGPQDRDETILGHKPFAVIAHHLARNGIASLRCDDRGAGASSPLTGKETTLDFAHDARDMIAFLRTNEHIDSRRVGFLGHSEGGLIALLNAGSDMMSKPDFIITLAAPTVKGSDLMRQQNIDLTAMTGQTLGADVLESLDAVYGLLTSDATPDILRPQVVKQLTTAMKGMPETTVLQTADQMLTPWYREMLRLDPTDAMRHITCPVLALYGEYDAQVNATLCAKAAAHTMPHATVTTLPACNHLFQHCDSRANSLNYAVLGDIDTAALNAITDFLTTLH